MSPFPVINNSYSFECTMCGHCCTGDQTVLLNLYDLYKMARFEKMQSTRGLFDNGRVMLVSDPHGVWRPKIAFKKKPFMFCPYLLNQMEDDGSLKGLCTLHPQHKPLVCATAPVGRGVDLESNSEEFIYAWPAPDCPGVHKTKENLLSDLKKKYGEQMRWEDRYFRLLQMLAGKGWSRDTFLEQLYVFDVRAPFTTILKNIEQKLMTGA